MLRVILSAIRNPQSAMADPSRAPNVLYLRINSFTALTRFVGYFVRAKPIGVIAVEKPDFCPAVA
jgi:hypothetical protein